jgi:hypothetical protein
MAASATEAPRGAALAYSARAFSAASDFKQGEVAKDGGAKAAPPVVVDVLFCGG